eukprot:sb/3470421/
MAKNMPKMDPATMPYAKFTALIHKNLPEMGFPVTPAHVSMGFWGLMALWTAVGVMGSAFLTNFLGILYPAWQSYKCEKERKPASQWLAYWIIYSLFFLLEISPSLIAKIPCYYTIKLGILLWCMYPGVGNGADLVYSNAIRPALHMLDGVMGDNPKAKKGGAGSGMGDRKGSLNGDLSALGGNPPKMTKSSSRDSLSGKGKGPKL